MKRGRASTTSTLVAFFRALADAGCTSARGFADPTARRLLPDGWAGRFEKSLRRAEKKRFRAALEQAADLIALRTMLLDAFVREAVGAGATQLVILGAGLDGRAFRMPELADVDVFEVDHPDTQAAKREKSDGLAATCRSLRFVPVDFTRDGLDGALRSAGHREREPTAWLWEGVVMYLRDEALRSTLDVVAARSAPASKIAIQYNTRAKMSFVGRMFLRFWGEPQVGLRDPPEIAAELERVGFAVESDSAVADCAGRFGAETPRQSMAWRYRVVVARRAS